MHHYHVKVDGVSWCQYEAQNPLALSEDARDAGVSLVCAHNSDLQAADMAMFLRKHNINAYVVDGKCDQQGAYVEDDGPPLEG